MRSPILKVCVPITFRPSTSHASRDQIGDFVITPSCEILRLNYVSFTRYDQNSRELTGEIGFPK